MLYMQAAFANLKRDKDLFHRLMLHGNFRLQVESIANQSRGARRNIFDAGIASVFAAVEERDRTCSRCNEVELVSLRPESGCFA